MSGTSLIFARTASADVGVRVVSYLEAEDPSVPAIPGSFPPIARPGVPSFYYAPTGRPHYSIPTQFEQMAGVPTQRKETVKQAVLHHDGMSTSQGCFNVLKSRSLSTHLMINWDGTVFQPLDLAHTAYHAAGGVNGTSVGIDLCNPIRLDRLHRDESALSRGGIFSGTINGGSPKSLGYHDAQYRSLIAVLRGLKEIFPKFQLQAPIDETGRVARSKLKSPEAFAGIIGHWHVLASKWDPGPGFDWERVLIGVRGSQLYFPVTLPNTRNLAQVPKEKAFEFAQPYYENNEAGDGGYFPVGASQAWHSGIHVHAKADEPVLAPADGKIVVARSTEPDARMGSPNLVLIQHSLKLDDGEAKTVYSMLMHLRPELVNPESAVPWIRRLVARGMGDESLPDTRDGKVQSAPGLMGLSAGRVALLTDVEIKAGEVIGHVGTFAPDFMARSGGTQRPLLDFAMFSGPPIVEPSSRIFEFITDDQGDDILCNSRAIWRRIIQKPEELRGLSEGAYPLAPREIASFFMRTTEAVPMRWIIARHPIEWSDKTRFDALFGGGSDFEWSTKKQATRYLQKIRKFLWWDAAVTKHADLPADRMVYCYHPYTLLAYLSRSQARNARRADKNGGLQEAFTGDELRKQALQDRAEDALGQSLDNCNLTFTDDLDGGENTDQLAPEDNKNERWMEWDQGEWEPE